MQLRINACLKHIKIHIKIKAKYLTEKTEN